MITFPSRDESGHLSTQVATAILKHAEPGSDFTLYVTSGVMPPHRYDAITLGKGTEETLVDKLSDHGIEASVEATKAKLQIPEERLTPQGEGRRPHASMLKLLIREMEELQKLQAKRDKME
jgi:hypothetical protein